MKKELALATLAAILTANPSVRENHTTDHETNEVTMDHYVTGCQCKTWKPRWSNQNDDSVDIS